MPRELTIKEAAAALGVSERTVNRMITDGRLPSHTDGRSRIVVVPDEAVSDDAPAEPAPLSPVAVASVPAVVEIAVLHAKLEALERENARLWRLVETQEARAAIQLPPPMTERPGLLTRIKAYLR